MLQVQRRMMYTYQNRQRRLRKVLEMRLIGDGLVDMAGMRICRR